MAKGGIGAFLFLYIPVVVFGSAANFTPAAIGVPQKALSVVLWILLAVIGFKNRRTLWSSFRNWVARLGHDLVDAKHLPTWLFVLATIYVVGSVAAWAWLPWWAGYGLWLGMTVAIPVLEEVERLGQQYDQHTEP
jgi:hypothetical protein